MKPFLDRINQVTFMHPSMVAAARIHAILLIAEAEPDWIMSDIEHYVDTYFWRPGVLRSQSQ